MQDVKKDRNKYIGGSDIPIIMNLSPFKTRFQLLREKAGYEVSDFEGNAYTEYGNIMEPKIRDYVSKEYGMEFVEGKHYEIAYPLQYRCHTDGENENTILEIKTTSQVHENIDDYKMYLVQLLFYMEQAEKRYGMLAVYERPDDFNEEFKRDRLNIFEIDIEDYSNEVYEILKAVQKFQYDFSIVNDNPLATEEDLIPYDIKDLANNVLELEETLRRMKHIEDDIKRAKEMLKERMQAKGVKKFETDTGIKITLIEDKEPEIAEYSEFDTDRFANEHPKLYKQYTKKGFRFTNGKKGYVKITLPKGDE